MGKKGRNRKKTREKREHKYYKVPCSECGRKLNMKKGKKPKCPYCRRAKFALKKQEVHVINDGPNFFDISTIPPSGVNNE